MITSSQRQSGTLRPNLAPDAPNAPAGAQAGPGRAHISGIALLLLGLVAYTGLTSVHLSTSTLTHSSLPMTLRWVGLAFVVYLVMLWVERRGQVSMPIIWIGAIAFQGLLLLTTPTLSDDVYRYLWDGHVADHNVSPYAHPIDAPELDELEVPVRSLSNHAWMASPYLPAAQWLFRSVAILLPLQARSMQWVMILINLAVGLLIVALLSMAGLPRFRVAIYLWNPLVVVETAHGAHLDVWMVLLTLFAAWTALVQWDPASSGLRRSRRFPLHWLSPVALGMATMTKIIPMLLLPVFYWLWQKRWTSVAIYVVTITAVLLPIGIGTGWGLTGPLDGRGLFGALRIYGDRWNYNSGLFHWLEIGLRDAGWGLSPELANQWAKRAVALLLLVTLLLVWHYARRISTARATLRIMSIPFMAYALLTTTFHPWYLLPVMAFLPFLAPGPGEPAGKWLFVLPWLYLSAALFLSYLTYLDPLNLRELEWVRKTEWLPTLAFLLLAIIVWLIQYRGIYRQPTGRIA